MPIDRIAPTRRPPGRPIGYQTWSELLFVHWRIPAELVRPLLPPELTLDTWEGEAWVGLVPFRMSRIHPWWFPPVPGISYFLETNVRTYVHYRNRDPGVWFCSLEASNAFAVRVARWRWRLPYFHAAMTLTRDRAQFHYASRRLPHGPDRVGCDITVDVKAPPDFPLDNRGGSTAVAGTLEHFLVERYVLYAQDHAGRLLRGQVHHSPYQLRPARLQSLSESLLEANGIIQAAEPCHTLFSDRVQVEVFPLRPVSTD